MSLPPHPPTPNRHNTAPASSFLTPSRPSQPTPAPTPAAAQSHQPPAPQYVSIHLQSGADSGGDLLQRHLQACFLAGSCADVRVRVDRWDRVYKLHKAVLTQAGFFESMFCGDFAEGQDASSDSGGGGPVLMDDDKGWSSSGESEIHLRMEDPNISRAAFEILLARLYATGPPLHISSATHPTAKSPLSPAFPFLPAASSTPPQGSQPASPRFLLSLLATSIFLGMPGVTQSVMNLVIGNVSPWSVGVYLGFAIGRGVGGFGGEDWEDGAGGKAAVGLESIGRAPKPRRRDSGDRRGTSREGIKTDSPTPTPSTVGRSSSTPAGSTNSRPASPTPSAVTASSSSSSLESDLIQSLHSASEPEPTFFYGLTSAKIGEACAVWLCKWGGDILDVEEHTHAVGVMGVEERFGSIHLGSRGDKGKASTAGLFLSPGSTSSTPAAAHLSVPVVFPPVFSLGGLPAAWVRAIISSDAFFVKSELERYKIARRVYELRRAQLEAQRIEGGGAFDDDDDREEEEEEEEEEFERLFSGGILYAHMTFDELAFISQDLCASSGMPYAPLPILQTSLWQHQELQSKILASIAAAPAPTGPLYPGSASSGSSVDAAEELGIAVSALDIAQRIDKARSKEHRRQRRRSRSLTRLPAGAAVPSPASTSRADKGKHRADEPVQASLAAAPSSSNTSAGGLGGGLASLESRRYWPVPTDDTHRLGAWGGFVDLNDLGGPVGPLSLAVADLGPQPRGSAFSSGSDQLAPPPGVKAAAGAESEATHFGIGSKMLTGAEVAASFEPDSGAADSGTTFTGYEPYRWGVEFHDVGRLKEKQRLYSETRAYAGSLFNCYVQQVRRKDRAEGQLGLYLHRQSPHEPIPAASAPPARQTFVGQPSQDSSGPPFGSTPRALFEPASFSSSATGGSSFLGSSPVPLSRTYSALHSSATHPSAPPPATMIPTTSTAAPTRGPILAFHDTRKTVKLFFSLSCSSSLGTALTCFASAPDDFLGSQSWGFRSSSLRSQEYLSSAEGDVLPEEDTLVWSGHLDDDRLKCLRVTIVLGLV